MLTEPERKEILQLLHAQVVPAIGCTEPMAVALCVARATELLGCLPERIDLRLSANIQNLLTITGYDGYDPEIGASTQSANVFGLDNGRYPSPTTYSFGLNITF